MQKFVGAVRFNNAMPRADALRYWRETHGPLVAKVPGLRKYIQNHAATAPENDLQFDGTLELWFDRVDAFQAAAGTPEWQAVMEDSAKFVDMGRSWLVPAEEVSIL